MHRSSNILPTHRIDVRLLQPDSAPLSSQPKQEEKKTQWSVYTWKYEIRSDKHAISFVRSMGTSHIFSSRYAHYTFPLELNTQKATTKLSQLEIKQHFTFLVAFEICFFLSILFYSFIIINIAHVFWIIKVTSSSQLRCIHRNQNGEQRAKWVNSNSIESTKKKNMKNKNLNIFVSLDEIRVLKKETVNYFSQPQGEFVLPNFPFLY